MRRILFTGPRKLLVNEREFVCATIKEFLPKNLGESCLWIIGDAPGVDTMAGNIARNNECNYLRLEVKPELRHKKWGYAERSQRMVNSLSAGDIAIGFPNKPCPNSCTPKSPWNGGGSGTWGTLAASKAVEGVKVIAYPLKVIELPNWLRYQQLNLFTQE
ncbi:MAG: hypothetical protein F6K24_39740 [Okeania sp. SIO2D1]|nr:hypothetical protein [Okeania sp. SIO2D1]